MQDDRQVVVIGTGPGGAAAAHFLVRAGIATTVLEAGPERGSLGLMVRLRGATLVHWNARPLSRRTDALSFADNPQAELPKCSAQVDHEPFSSRRELVSNRRTSEVGWR